MRPPRLLLLHADSFDRFQSRTETTLDPVSGSTTGVLAFRNVTVPGGLALPRSRAWNVELNQRVGRNWMVRANYRERHASDQTIVERLPHAPDGPVLRLASSGRSTVREFDTTVRRRLPHEGELFVSFSKRRATGDLNDFGSLYGNLRDPLVLDSTRGTQPFDVPSRFLLWGTVHLPKSIVVTPALAWRSGYPYTVFDEQYAVVGARNAGGRFPSFLSADLRITKAVELAGRRTRVGIELLNLTNHSNPRDVVDNRASSNFRRFRNSVNLSVRLRLELSL